jgi:tetratricopeptide (TPR) repeat protein
MADGALSIKLRCASWQQLATIYKRDLSHGTMFLKAATPPAIGTTVHIDLTLPSGSVIALTGTVHDHLNDPQRGAGIELKLDPIPAGSVWLIESALASENRRLATPAHGVSTLAAHQITGLIPTITESADVAAAEHDLIKALVSEAESLKKLNPFLVLGVGYEATDTEVRAAFAELTKRYHPDRFARYESAELRQVAAEIFILIRDAYRRLGDAPARAQLLQSLGKPAPAPRAVPAPPRVSQTVPPPRATQRVPVVSPPPIPGSSANPPAPPAPPPAPTASATPAPGRAVSTRPSPTPGRAESTRPSTPPPPSPDAPTAVLTPPVGTPGAPGTPGTPPVAIVPPVRPPTTPPPTRPADARRPGERPSGPPATVPASEPSRIVRRPSNEPAPADRRVAPVAPPEALDSSALEDLIDQGKLDEALAGYRVMVKKHPQDRNLRAGVELCEGLRALAARDRLEAAQRFEAALEIDPSNERAARELAEMRRQATNERKGLLSRLMGKKEP